MPFLMEMELWVRLLNDGDFFGLPRTLISFRISSSSMTALTSARSQLSQQLKFSRRLVEDRRWKVSAAHRLIGRVNCYQMQLRRTLLLRISAVRDRRRRRRLDEFVSLARNPDYAAPGLE